MLTAIGRDNATPHEQRILAFFHERPGSELSGTELAERLGVSRTAIWKQISGLRAQGYVIAAIPSRGYRLVAAPDLLTPAELLVGLATARLGKKILVFREIDSTNTAAYRLAEEGEPEGTVLVAEQQLKGKGRLGREWCSPPGVNLYCSVILRPPIAPPQAFQLTFLSAVAVARTIAAVTAIVPRIKWPNDILANGRKVAGLLNEMSAETDGVNFVILGIGVNLNMQSAQFPTELRHPASSLQLIGGKPVDRIRFTRVLLEELDRLYGGYLEGGFPAIRDEWLACSGMTGRHVRVGLPGGTEFAGTVRGVAEDGALLVARTVDQVERVLAGDVKFLD